MLEIAHEDLIIWNYGMDKSLRPIKHTDVLSSSLCPSRSQSISVKSGVRGLVNRTVLIEGYTIIITIYTSFR